jgi:hypothetical protein
VYHLLPTCYVYTEVRIKISASRVFVAYASKLPYIILQFCIKRVESKDLLEYDESE